MSLIVYSVSFGQKSKAPHGANRWFGGVNRPLNTGRWYWSLAQVAINSNPGLGVLYIEQVKIAETKKIYEWALDD